MDDNKPARGFARMTLEDRRKCARLGGQSVDAANRPFSQDRDLARRAAALAQRRTLQNADPSAFPLFQKRKQPVVDKAAGRLADLDCEIGATLRKLRRGARMNQMVLARRLGLSRQQLQKYEEGRNRISVATLLACAEALACEVMALLPPSEADRQWAQQAEAAFAQISSEDTRQAVLAYLGALDPN